MATTTEQPTKRPSRRSTKQQSASRTRLWTWLLLPPAAWMVTFFVSGMSVIALLSFGITAPDGLPRFSNTLVNYTTLWNSTYLEIFVRSVLYAVGTVVLCVLIAYPVAYAIALHGGRYKQVLMAAVVVPVLRQLPGADVRLVVAAQRRGRGQRGAAQVRDQ